jgi:threonyl-tRNA synthetase
MFRNERSGVVGGLSRVRQMTLNDGHVFCSPEQLEPEIEAIVAMVEEAYRTLAIPPPRYRLSLPDDQSKFVRNDELWRRSQAVLRSALRNMDIPYDEASGEAAFYGPKIDLQVGDAHGREQTLSTVQVDFHLPARFGLEAHDGARRLQPVMVHRSIVSTMERMVAHLLEVHDGALPLWLAPSQVRILPIVTGAVEYSLEIRARCRAAALRAEIDDRDSSLAARIRDTRRDRIPCIAVVGQREVDNRSVAVRLRDGRQLESMPAEQFVAVVGRAAQTRDPRLFGTNGSPPGR